MFEKLLKTLHRPNRQELEVEWYQNAAPGQIRQDRGVSDMDTARASQWHRGTQSNPVTEMSESARGIGFPWRVGQPSSPRGIDFVQPGVARPLYAPLKSPLKEISVDNADHLRQQLQTINPGLQNSLPPPKFMRLMRRPGISLMAGIAQLGTQQYSNTVGHTTILPPPIVRYPSRGPRSITGIRGRVGGAGQGQAAIPGVFAPKETR